MNQTKKTNKKKHQNLTNTNNQKNAEHRFQRPWLIIGVSISLAGAATLALTYTLLVCLQKLPKILKANRTHPITARRYQRTNYLPYKPQLTVPLSNRTLSGAVLGGARLIKSLGSLASSGSQRTEKQTLTFHGHRDRVHLGPNPRGMHCREQREWAQSRD